MEALFVLDGISGAQGSVSSVSDASGIPGVSSVSVAPALGASVASANISYPDFLSREKDGCNCSKADSRGSRASRKVKYTVYISYRFVVDI